MECPACKKPLREKGAGGIWLDAGEFSLIYKEIQRAKISPPGLATTMTEAAKLVE